MTSRDFCYWLQGFFELATDGDAEVLEPKQVDMIRKHLALVFKHEIDPSAGPPEHQAELNEIHSPKSRPPKPVTEADFDEPAFHGPDIRFRC